MRSLSRLRRLFEILLIIRRYGMDELLVPLPPYHRWISRALKLLPGPTPAIQQMTSGERLRETLQTLGPIFVKLGQLLSMRADLLSEEYINELQLLQDRVPPFPGTQAMAIVEESLNMRLESVFSHFDIEPIASASVAQVHQADLVSGEKVVVKVLRPDVEKDVRRDIDLLYMVAAIVTWIWPEAKLFRAKELVSSGERALQDSLDLVIEAANASRFRANFVDDETIYIPKVYWDYTRTKVMVMERIEGIRFADVEALRESGIDLHELAIRIVELFCKQVFRDGYFHGDFHPGNVFVGRNGQYRVVDFGIMGTVTDDDRALIADILTGLTRRDYRAVAEAGMQSGWAPRSASVDSLELRIRAVAEPIFDKSVEEIPIGWVLGRLFNIMSEFEINIQPHLLVLQHTIASIEGEVRALYPELKLSQSLRPHLERWARERYGFAAVRQRLAAEFPYWVSHSHELPRLAHEVISSMRDRQAHQLELRGEEVTFRKIEMLYRRIFFGFAGLVIAVSGIVRWGISGFGFLVFLCVAVSIGCFIAALPRFPRKD